MTQYDAVCPCPNRLAAYAGLLLWAMAAAADIVIYDQAPAADAAYFPGTKVTAKQPTPAGARQLLEFQGYICSTHPLLQDLYDVEVTALVRARVIDKQFDYNFRGVGVAARYQPYRQMVENWLYFQTFDRAVAEKAWDVGNGCVTTAHFGTEFKLAFVDSRMYRGGATELAAQTSQAPVLEKGKWYYYKLHLQGDEQRAKVWAAGNDEPDYQVLFRGIESAPGSIGFRAVGGTTIAVADLRVQMLGAEPTEKVPGATGRLRSIRTIIEEMAPSISLDSDAGRFTAYHRMKQLADETTRRLPRHDKQANTEDRERIDAALAEAEGIQRRLASGGDPYSGITGLMERAYRSDIDGALQPYALYIPPDYRPDKAWPLIVMLHGTSGNTRIQLVHAGLQAPGRVFPYVVIGPGGRGASAGYDRFGEIDVWDAMAAVESTYNIDKNRVYLTGLSLGGDGTVLLSYIHPDRFAAVAPFGIGFGKWRAPNFWNLPIRFGLTDQEGVKNDVEYRQILADDGLPGALAAVYSREDFPETATFGQKPAHFHASTVPDYRLGRVFDFFASHRRNPFPKKVAFENLPNRLGQFYWFEVKLVTLLKGKWRVELEVGDDNLVQLRTWHVARLRLFLNDQLVDMQRPVRVTNNDTLVYDGPAKDILEVALAEPPKGKLWKGRPGTFGSFLDFFYYPVVYVYGTAGNAGETEQLAHEVQIAAGWEGQMHVDFPVIPEERVTEEMMRNHNLVLFGTPATSGLLKRLLPGLPLVLSATELTIAGKRHEGRNVGVKLLYPNPLAPGRMLQIVTGTGMPALKDSAVVAEHASKTYYKQAWLGEDFIVFDDTVKAFQRAVRADRKHPFAHHVEFRKGVRRLLRDYGIFAMDWEGIDSRKGMEGSD